MEERDVKKTFVIPKTHATSKDVLISEKLDSRNVTELFDDLKSSALDSQFDFRTNFCKSCDLIRNPKLQKLYTERRSTLKKEHEPSERLAFHYILQRDIALKIATDGIQCEQLTLPMDKYLGNPKDGVHLSKRADVLLTFTGTQGLCKFGLLVCKTLLGKGYPTIPSAVNNQLSAQLHFDHHFCKILPNQPETKTVDDPLAASLVFCYEHEDFQPVSHPSQILPIAVLWYELKEKFPSENSSLAPTMNRNLARRKPTNGTWEEPKPISQFLIPFQRTQSQTTIGVTRDPRLLKKKVETIPLSPQCSILENGTAAKISPTPNDEILSPMKTSAPSTTVKIPLSSLIPLPDPRIVSLTPNRTVVYLEFHAVKHYFQQQKRSNHHYTLIPYSVRQVSLEEFERISAESPLTPKAMKTSLKFDPSSLFVSAVDCFAFGFSKSSNQPFIDLERTENRLAFEQMQMSNELIAREGQLNSQKIRLRLREKRQRKFQHHLNEKRSEQMKIASSHPTVSPTGASKSHLVSGRQMLKEYPLTSTSANTNVPSELLEFLSSEYRHEHRSHVKHLLAELVGIFIEKYSLERPQKHAKPSNNAVVDMELASPSPTTRGDYDERFPLPTPPPSLLCASLPTNPLAIDCDAEPSSNVANGQETPTPLLTTKTESISPVDEPTTDEGDRSRDELVRLLAKKVYVATSSSSPTEKERSPQPLKRSPEATAKKLSSTRTVTLVSDRSIIGDPIETNDGDEEPMAKRQKTDRNDETDERSLPLKSRTTLSKDSTKKDEEAADRRQVISSHSKEHRHRSTTRRESPQMRKFSRESDERSRTYSKSSMNGRRNSPSPPRSTHPRRSTSDRHRPSDSSYPRAMNDVLGPTMNGHPPPSSLSHRRFNYNHQSVADHPRFTTFNGLPPMEMVYPRSPPPLMSLDRSFHLSHAPDSSRSSRSGISRSFDMKRPEHFQRFDLYIEKSSQDAYEHSTSDYSKHSNGHRSSRSSRSQHDNDPPPPLRMVQRLHN